MNRLLKDTWPYPLLIAHRGAGGLAPENTLAAFRLGAQYGYRAFECDVQLSADGALFLLHDSTLNRTTSGQGDAFEHHWAALSQLDAGSWHSPIFAGEPLLCLNRLAIFCHANGFMLNLEIKSSPGFEAATGRAVGQEVARLWGGRLPWPLLSSFSFEALYSALTVAPMVPRALLLEKLHADWLNQAKSLACTAVVMAQELLTPVIVKQLHHAGLRALAYTVNERKRALELIEWGVDSLITDAIESLIPKAIVYANENYLR
jgi:glycerophosphoryl diester phosphodiesterase